jgi:RNA polymerase sigma factor (sigma-70 family)
LTEEELLRIRLVLTKLTSIRIENAEDAEDLVQDTLLTMVRKAPTIEVEKGMMIWAMGILRRKVGNYYRRTQRFLVRDAEIRYAMKGRSMIPSPESNLHHAELSNIIDSILVTLSPQERTAMDLYLAGRHTGEIVALLSAERYQNVANRLHRGRKKILKELARHGYMKRAVGMRRRKKNDGIKTKGTEGVPPCAA